MNRVNETLKIRISDKDVKIKCIADHGDRIEWEAIKNPGLKGWWDGRLWDVNQKRIDR